MAYGCQIARALGSQWRHKQRFRLHKIQNGKCYWCSTPCTLFPPPSSRKNRQMQIDHLVAVAEGGTHDEDNLVGACHECNQKRGRATKQRILGAKLNSENEVIC